MERRQFLLQTLAAAAASEAPASAWDQGLLLHLLSTAGDRRLLVKSSFSKPLKAPVLRAGRVSFEGRRSDTAGLFWMFDATGLQPATEYTLQLVDGRKELCAPWKLRTLPEPGQKISRFRLLIYTCAGGHPALKTNGQERFLSLERRRRMLTRAMSFQPDAVVANGDHVYWDLRTGGGRQGSSPEGIAHAAEFDRSLPVLGTNNEAVLNKSVGPQIASLYGVLFREVPVWFVTDDHDHFENDEANDRIVSFPPDAFMMRAVRATRRLYYPEFLPDPNRPAGLAGAAAADTPAGSAEAFGTLRYGNLAEILLYDCRRYLTLAGPTATFVPPEVERWLTARMAARDTSHVVNVPSVPIGWSAGKWGDWYSDYLDAEGRLGTKRPKPFWQPGWLAQHDRLLKAASDAKERIPLFLCGDLHAIGDARIRRSGNLDLSANPVVAMLTGPVSTGRTGWPSMGRGTPPLPPQHLDEDQKLKALEENGFTIVDFTPDRIDFQFFKWSLREPDEALDRMEPFYRTQLARPA